MSSLEDFEAKLNQVCTIHVYSNCKDATFPVLHVYMHVQCTYLVHVNVIS